MPILKIDSPPTPAQIALLSEELPGYIKLVADLKKQLLYGGCRLHADAEQILLKEGSKQADIWGGGVDLVAQRIDLSAIANIRPSLDNPSPEILNPATRKRFTILVKKYFPDFS
jgi:hypothetical protein